MSYVFFETDVGFRVASRPVVAKSWDPYSMWTGSVCGHAHTPSVAHATDVVIQVVSRWGGIEWSQKQGPFFASFFPY